VRPLTGDDGVGEEENYQSRRSRGTERASPAPRRAEGEGVDRSGAVGQICGCNDARRREGGVGLALVLEHRVQPSRISTPKLPVSFSTRNSPTPGLVSLMGLPTPPTLTLCVAVFCALCLNPGTDAESSKQVPLKKKVTASAPYSMDRYMLGFLSDTVAVTLKEMVELDAESVGASTNCSTAASVVALGENTMPKASTRTVMRLGFFWIRTGEEKQGSRAGVHRGGGGECTHRTTEGLYGVSDGPDRWKAEHVRGSLPLRALIGSIDIYIYRYI
jgi:hypothetical protein